MAQTKVIYKEVLEIKDLQEFHIEGLHNVLSVAVQRDQLVMYYIKDLTSENTPMVEVCIKGAGNLFDGYDCDDMEFKGTHLMANDSLVWHVWVNVTRGRSD